MIPLLDALVPVRPLATDRPAIGLVVVACGFLAAAHVACVVRVARGHGLLAALVALVVPPVAPFRAARNGARIWPGVWLLAATAYAVGRYLGTRPL